MEKINLIKLSEIDKNSIIIRRFENNDATEVSKLIIKTLQTSNIKDYCKSYIEESVLMHSASNIIKKASWTHFYVAILNDFIIGCGAIAPYYDKEDESFLSTIFVLPEYQRNGIGKKIVEVLMQDIYYIRAKRIEIPSSITACDFYLKLGFNYKNGIDSIDDEKLYRLEKFK